jgi:rhodanese-related sulfurtransferase
MMHHARSLLFVALLLAANAATSGCDGDDATPTDALDEATPDTDGGADADADADADVADVADSLDVVEAVDADDVVDASPEDGSAAPCPLEEVAVVTNVTVDQLRARVVAGDLLAVIDVREPTETAGGIIEGALLYPWTSGVLSADHAALPTDRPLYVICGSGGRSVSASAFLVDNGHFCVHNVQGGMSAWRTAGYPTVTP